MYINPLYTFSYNIHNNNNKDNMGNKLPKGISFEDVKIAIQNPTKYIILNTLPDKEQNILILNTIPSSEEEQLMNSLISDGSFMDKIFIIYGKNSTEMDKLQALYKKLQGLGIYDIQIYYGGLFEWVLLQEIYGEKEFPTTNKVKDILQYRK